MDQENGDSLAMTRRIVITGMGVACPLAIDLKSYWDALVAGKSGIGRIELLDTSAFKVKIGGEVKNWQPEKHLDTRAAHRLDRFAHFAMVAAGEAIRDSGLDLGRLDLTRCGVLVGSGIGGANQARKQPPQILHGRDAEGAN